MGFTDFVSDAGLTLLNNWVKTRSYIVGYGATQADVKVFESFTSEPDFEKYPHASRWYKHIASFKSEFASLPGDPTKAATAYGPESSELTLNPAKAPEKAADDEDDDVDLFGSDEEEEDPEKAAETARRLEEYRKKKEGKVKPAAKSVVTLDVKPWDDETNLEELEEKVRSIAWDGLLWGKSAKVPIGYGIHKIQFTVVVEDDKVSLDELQEEIANFEDHVQSSDVVAMQKL